MTSKWRILTTNESIQDLHAPDRRRWLALHIKPLNIIKSALSCSRDDYTGQCALPKYFCQFFNKIRPSKSSAKVQTIHGPISTTQELLFILPTRSGLLKVLSSTIKTLLSRPSKHHPRSFDSCN